MGLFCDVRWLWVQIKARFDRQDATLAALQTKLQKVWMWTLQPASIDLVVVSEGDDGMLRFKVVLPYRSENQADWDEITGGKLVVKIGDAEPLVISTPKALQEIDDPTQRMLEDPRFVGAQDIPVLLRFAHLDDATPANESTYVERTQTLTDTVPPVAPTSIGLIEVEEFTPGPPEPISPPTE